MLHSLPALLLEQLASAATSPAPPGAGIRALEGISLHQWLASVAAPSQDGLSIEAQRRAFKQRLQKARAQKALQPAFAAAYELLLGACRGLAALHAARIVHRDLTEPGKNIIVKRDGRGLTAAMIDFSQAERCPSGHGAAARAIDMFGFGNLLWYVCFGRVAHSLPWTK